MYFYKDLEMVEILQPEKNLVILRYKNVDPSNKQVEAFGKALDTFYEQIDSPYYLITDLRQHPSFVSAEARIATGNLLKRLKPNILKWNVEASFLTKGIGHQMMMKAIFVIQGYPIPYKVFKSVNEIVDWLEEKNVKTDYYSLVTA